jgi:copper chaperone
MLRFNVEGMSCGHCVGAVTRAVQGLDPQADVRVDLAAKTVEARTTVASASVAKAIEDAGYAVRAA